MTGLSLFVLFINLLIYVLIWQHSSCTAGALEYTPKSNLALPVLHNMKELKTYQYRRIAPIKIVNSGGGELTQCTASNLPRGLEIHISNDQATCVLVGVPHHHNATSEALIIALNAAGSSSIKVPITVHVSTFE